MFTTHQVTNQAQLFAPDNLFSCDLALQEALIREAPTLGQGAIDQMQVLGQQIAAAAKRDLARLANQNRVILGSATKDLHRAQYLFITTDDRI